MPGWFETQISITAPATNPGCQAISPRISGVLTYIEYDAGGVPIDFGELLGMDIIVSYDGTVLGIPKTQAPDGDYTLAADTYILDAGVQTLTANFEGSGVYPAAQVTTPIEIIPCNGSEDLPAQFWISKWRAPSCIEADTYGALLCIDPNGLRTDHKGPVIFVLDDLNFSPGLTEKSGVMRGLINDNAYPPLSPGRHPEGRVDMELLKEGTIWIRDEDEFWIGVQRGPDGGEWDPTGGGDGEGSGRRWLMGGYINKRYYQYTANGEITAILIGKDYMDVWKDQIFGTPLIPRNYTEATDLGTIARQVVEDINIFQPPGWRYTGHPTYFPTSVESDLALDYPAGVTSVKVEDASLFDWAIVVGVPAILMDSNSQELVRIIARDLINNILYFPLSSPTSNAYNMIDGAKVMQLEEIGIEWKKEFNQEASNSVMTEICDEASYEWRIDYRKRVMLYARTSAPWAPTVRFDTNIRKAPEIVMGDTTERITHVIVTESAISSIPPDIDSWCLSTALWPDYYNTNRTYSASSIPAPPNPVSPASYSDSSLVMDDEGHPGLCFQKDYANGFFGIQLSLHRDSSDHTHFGNLNIDLREWRKIIFKFRHATRADPDPAPGTRYRIRLHTELNEYFRYEFGTGEGGAFDQQGEGLTTYDTIDDEGWTRIELVLPELDVEGNILHLYDWVESLAPFEPDPTKINWASISVWPAEPDPGSIQGIQLEVNANIGDRFIQLKTPAPPLTGGWYSYAGLPQGTSGDYMFWQSALALLDTEEVRIRRGGPSLSGANNIELEAPLLANHAANTRLNLRAGWIISLSQFRFERDLRYTTDPASPVPPYRYRMMVSREMESLNEAKARADGIVIQEEPTMTPVRVVLDGDPRFEIGYNPRLYLNVDPFDAEQMFIDDITYALGSDVDFRLTILLGQHSRRPRELTEHTILDTHDRQLRNLGVAGTVKMVRRGR